MPKGTKKADVLNPFNTRILELRAQALAQAKELKGEGFRKWNIPEDLDATNLFTDLAILHGSSDKGFDRTEINKRYEQCFQDPASPGTVGDVIGLKLQMDWLAAAERAFRYRHASVPRLLSHGMCRRWFQAMGPSLAYVETSVRNIIAAGALE